MTVIARPQDFAPGGDAAPPQPGEERVVPGVPPFDAARLDALLAEQDVDAVVTTSRQAAQYLLGGYSFSFFDHRDAIGLSRYLPVVVYVRGRPDLSAYIAHRLEKHEHQLGRFWTPAVRTVSGTTTDAVENALDHLRGVAGTAPRRVGVEPAFLPSDAAAVLRDGLPNCALVDVSHALERLRARKSVAELTLLREASERVVGSMLATFAACAPGVTKAELVERLRREEVGRGLTFEYCLITAGTGLNRAASPQPVAEGDIISLDSGGRYRGYIGDLCRMGVVGEPDGELEDLLGAVDAVQQRARRTVRAGARGGDVQAAGEEAVSASPHARHTEFLAHGMGLVQHEAPWLTAEGVIPYPAHDGDRALEAGMVLSIETTMLHPRRGFIKLEDTVVVTEGGHKALGDAGRGWNRAGRGG
jgi:Xaa-Pro aminopeptidase